MKSINVSSDTKSIKGIIRLDGSKSISNRVLLIRALCEDYFDINHLSSSDDTVTMNKLLNSAEEIFDAHHAGTTFRFLTAYFATKPGEQILTGSDRMKQRPIKALVDALRYLGASIEYLEEEGYPPLKILAPSENWKNHITLSADISSQYITALLLIAPSLPDGLTIELLGKIVSRPYIEMTIGILKHFGVVVNWKGQTIQVKAQKYIAKSYTVEADWSAASYYYEIAAFSETAEIELQGLYKDSLQGDSAIVQLGSLLGLHTEFSEQGILIRKDKTTVFPPYLEYDFLNVPDITQSISVLCGGIGSSVLYSGLQTLLIKETDRVAALKKEHAKMGVVFSKMPTKFSAKSGVEYYMQEGVSKVEHGYIPSIDTYKDHRMAMAFAPLGLLFELSINDPMVVSKSYPAYWDDLSSLGFHISEKY